MKTFNNYFVESILDPEQASLNPYIFDLTLEPKLKEDVRTQILLEISKLAKHVTVIDYTIIGSNLTRRYTPTSDIDVNILITNKNKPLKQIRDLAIKLSGIFVKNTNHPINLHVVNTKKDFDNANDSAEAVFDLSNNKFIKQASEKPFYVEKYLYKFKSLVKKINVLTDDLKDDIMDYTELTLLPHTDVASIKLELEKELHNIESSAVGLVQLYNQIHKDRAKAFAKALTTRDIKEYGEKNRLPENVVYKLLERYHYLFFLEKVKEILGDDKTVSTKDVEKLDDLIKSTTYSI